MIFQEGGSGPPVPSLDPPMQVGSNCSLSLSSHIHFAKSKNKKVIPENHFENYNKKLS